MRHLAFVRVRARAQAAMICVALFLITPNVSAETIPGLFPTGVDDFGSILGTGTLDAHYTLSGPAGPAIARSTDVAWLSPPAGSKWIGPSNGNNDPAGTYSYSISFDLTGLDLTTAVIMGRWTSDNDSQIFLNSAATGLATTRPQDPFRRLEPTFTLNDGFVLGINTLEFRVWNGGGPTALLVSELSGQAATMIPEPSTALLLATGLLGLAVKRRQRPQ